MRRIGSYAGPGPTGTFTDTSAAYRDYMRTRGEQVAFIELYTFTLATLGTPSLTARPDAPTGWLATPQIYRFASTDYDVAFEGVLYKGGGWNAGWRIGRGSLRHEIGTGTQELDLTILFDGADRLDPADGNSLTYRFSVGEALDGGLFDGALLEYRRLVIPAHPTYPIGPTSVSNRGDLGPGDTSLGAVWMFVGRISEVVVKRSKATVKAKTLFELLTKPMPPHVYQPACRWTLYDSNCTVSRTGSSGGNNYQYSSTIEAITAPDRFLITSGYGPSFGWFDRGTLQFTSGALCGLVLPVETWLNIGTTNVCIVGVTPPRPPDVGDSVTAQAGCDKIGLVRDPGSGAVSPGTCQTKFANLVNFGGEPHIPPPSTAY